MVGSGEVVPLLDESYRIGVIGCGKLGLMAALTFESRGHEVKGYDVSPYPAQYLADRAIPYQEVNSEELLANTKMEMVELEELVEWADILMAAPQTPHEARFEGSTPIPKDRKDFDYTYLKEAVTDVSDIARRLGKKTILAVISTCLPGTYEREIAPIVEGNENLDYIYQPYFIAMGTVYQDVLNPEFVLLGHKNIDTAVKMAKFYATLHDRPVFETDITTAEGIKVFYNTFITMKTVLANTYGEMAEKLGMNVDDIYQALSLATDRIISPKYLKAGVGDGGGCHPRDNIALSWLAKEVKLSHNIFEDLMAAREDHMGWLAEKAYTIAWENNLPVVILGRSFKPETNIETGSASILMSNILKEHGVKYEHVEDKEDLAPAVYVIGTQHERYKSYSFPRGSIIVDPFGYIEDRVGVEVIRIGRK